MQDNLLKQLSISVPSPLQPLSIDVSSSGPAIAVKRDDLIHPVISGNKWRKLAQTLQHIQDSAPTEQVRIVSFGGGYSNHLHALSYCCKLLNWQLIACIRGNYLGNLSPMLQDMHQWGSELVWLTKSEYKQRSEATFVAQLQQRFHATAVIPEGGSARDNLDGFLPFVDEIPNSVDAIICPVASGGTMAGLLHAISKRERHIDVHGIAVLKGQGYLEKLVTDLLPGSKQDIHIHHDFHFGGYAKHNDQLQSFCQSFGAIHNLPLEPVYSGKLFYGALTLLQTRQLDQYDNVIFLHTGGMQGARQD
ncbi:MAG: 1-aminocyclopropane-1-carboxylate deaminase/D-cysteine desulfhydrase [Aestuariibacter sp.]